MRDFKIAADKWCDLKFQAAGNMTFFGKQYFVSDTGPYIERDRFPSKERAGGSLPNTPGTWRPHAKIQESWHSKGE
jgi:hypothetical protein